MKKILIIAPSNLPIPAVRGGAVETGIDQILIENEKEKNSIQIDVIGFFDEGARKEAGKYKKTNFWFYKNNWVDDVVDFLLRGINKIFKKINVKINLNVRPLFVRYICKNFELKNYDAILIKNAVNYVLPLSKYTNNNIYLQLHNDFLNSDTPNAAKIVKKCKKIISNSDYIKDRILTIGSLDKDDVLINMNCLAKESFKVASKKKKREIFSRYGIDNNVKIIFFSGRLIKEKGLKELVCAVKELNRREEWRLMIAGSKWFSVNKKDSFAKELETLSREISSNIIFLGYISHSEMSYYNSIADVVVVPSIWEEPAGRVALEAAAVGTPLIVTDSGGLKEYIDKNNSIVIKRNKKIIKNLADSIDRVIFGECISSSNKDLISFAKRFSSKRYYDEIMRYMDISEDMDYE